jgi:hypothetical protein
MTWIVVWGLTALAASALGGLVAGSKNRDYSAWMAWCFLMPPLLVLLLLMPRAEGSRRRRPTLDEHERFEV